MPGPPKKPEIVKRSEGNPGKRKLKREPKATPGIPDPPVWLSAVGRRCWTLLAQELYEMGALAKVDGPALEGVCAAYQMAIRCEKRLEKKGITFNAGNGYEQQRPEVSIREKAWSQYRLFCSHFGLTPAARANLALEAAGEEDDEMERLLRVK